MHAGACTHIRLVLIDNDKETSASSAWRFAEVSHVENKFLMRNRHTCGQTVGATVRKRARGTCGPFGFLSPGPLEVSHRQGNTTFIWKKNQIKLARPVSLDRGAVTELSTARLISVGLPRKGAWDSSKTEVCTQLSCWEDVMEHSAQEQIYRPGI